jgi:leader peptidase (prepilin peptidase)/N-methyltransferase
VDLTALEHIIIPFIILFGLCFGSFATALVYRIPRGEQFISGRSKCPTCKHELAPLDLLPIFSWLWLRGKCRYCKTEFGGGYPLVEIALTLMFIGIYTQMGITPASIIMALISTTIIILIAIDFEHYIIPDGINITLFILAISYQIANQAQLTQIIGGPLIGLAIGMGLRWLMQVWKKREGLGMGDVKFLFATGALIDPYILDLFLFLSGIIGLATALLWKLQKKGERFPFGPSLSIALYLCITYPELNIWWRKIAEDTVMYIVQQAA